MAILEACIPPLMIEAPYIGSLSVNSLLIGLGDEVGGTACRGAAGIELVSRERL
jgi:hypothetical protein